MRRTAERPSDFGRALGANFRASLATSALAGVALCGVAVCGASSVDAQLVPLPTLERTSTRDTFIDRGRRITAERLGVGASGRMRVRIADGERRYEAELGDGVVATLGPLATDAALASLGVEVARTLMASARLVLLRSVRPDHGGAGAEDGATPDSLALAARLASAPPAIVASAMPDLWLAHVRHFDVPPDDPRYGGQWYLDTIGIEGAWARSSGAASVTVAVVDDGCDLAHPDLAAHMLPGYDAIDDDDDPSYVPGVAANSHGTACAGLVAAVGDNAIGIAGACPECTLRCVRLLPGAGGLVPLSADVAAFDFILTSGSAVASNSWGFESGVPAPGPLVTAITTTIREGRGGLGTVVVFAAGNDDAVIDDDEVQATVGVVNVGAINQFDEAAPFSNNGRSLSLVAPTGTLTTDISGPDGDDAGDYTSSFGGTSSACPVVAGVAALLVAARPDAPGADVRTTLISTVRRAPFATPDADGHDLLYGYGIIDPTAALAAWLPGEADMGVTLDGGADLGVSAPPSDDGCGCVAAGAGHARRGALTYLGAALLVLLALLRRRVRRAGSTSILVACAAVCIAGCASTPEAVAGGSAELRPDTPGSTELPPRYDVGDVVETLDSTAGAFRIHYTRSGRHAVPSDDADTDGVPDYVALVADTYDGVLLRYEELGFVPARTDELVPIDFGGSARFDVYLLDYGGMSDGSFRREICAADGGCAGYMVQENDFLGYRYPTRAYAVHLLASHEFFHAIQAAYDGARDMQSTVLSEGTAVWASERFDASLSDVEGFASAYLDRTDRSLGTDPIGPVQAFAYGSGVFFEHLSVRYGDDVIVALWEAMPSAPVDSSWPETLDGVLTRDFDSSFDAAFLDFAERVVFLGPRADDTRGLPRASAFPGVAPTTVALPYADESLRVFPASARYFQAPANNGRFTVRTREGAAISGATVISFALDSGAVVAEARGLGEATLEVPVSADTVLFLIADGRVSGSSRIVSVCAETGASACADEAPDAGADVDLGAGDAGIGSDASPTPAPPSDGEGCGCRAHGASPRSNGAAWLILLVAVPLLRRLRAARAADSQSRGR